jgi:hypothetical protein
MSLLEDYGLTNPNSTRARILKLIASKEKETTVPKLPLNFKNISIALWGCPDIAWENLNTVWKSNRQRLANYWKCTDIEQNLETLCECGLVDGDEKEGYFLTDEGRQVAQEMM